MPAAAICTHTRPTPHAPKPKAQRASTWSSARCRRLRRRSSSCSERSFTSWRARSSSSGVRTRSAGRCHSRCRVGGWPTNIVPAGSKVGARRVGRQRGPAVAWVRRRVRRALRVVRRPEEVEVEGAEPPVEQVAEGALARHLVQRLRGVEAAVREDARHAARAPPPEEVRRCREEQPRCGGDRQAEYRPVAARHQHDLPPRTKHRLVDALEAGRGVVLGHKQAVLLALRFGTPAVGEG